MICTTKAIVLNNKKFSDSSLICNIYSEEYGKVSIIAKGARAIKNPNGAILAPLNHIDLIYYYKPKRNIQLFKEATIINKYYDIENSYNKILYSIIIADIINYVSYEQSPCNIIFRLINSSLRCINKSNDNIVIYYYIFFKLQLLIYLGYQPLLNKCVRCNQKINSGLFDNQLGQLVCIQCSKDQTQLSKESLQALSELSNMHIKDIANKLITSLEIMLEIKKYLFKFILYHIPELKKSKAFIAFNNK